MPSRLRQSTDRASRTRRRAIQLVGLLAVFTLIAAACGDDDDDDTTTADPTPTETASTDGSDGGDADADDADADGGDDEMTDDDGDMDPGMGEATDVGVTGESIKIAIINDTTGDNSSGHAGFEKGFEAWVEFFNESNGAHGRTIELVTYDAASDPELQRSQMQTANEQDEAFMIVGSHHTFGAAEYVAENMVPTISRWAVPGIELWEGLYGTNLGSWPYDIEQDCPVADCDSRNRPENPADTGGGVLAYLAAKMGVTKVGAFGYGPVQASIDAAKNLCEGAEEVQGIECAVLDTSLPFGLTDIGATAQLIKDADVSVFYAAMDVNGCIGVLRDLERNGIDHILQCGTGFGPDVLEGDADIIDDMIIPITAPPFTSDDPGMVEFVSEITERKPGEDLGTNILEGWVAGLFVGDALEATGANLTRLGFVATTRTDPVFAGWNANGLKPNIDWTTNLWEQYQDPGYTPDPESCTDFLMRPDPANNEWDQVGPTPRFCINKVLSPEALAAYVAADSSSLEVS